MFTLKKSISIIEKSIISDYSKQNRHRLPVLSAYFYNWIFNSGTICILISRKVIAKLVGRYAVHLLMEYC